MSESIQNVNELNREADLNREAEMELLQKEIRDAWVKDALKPGRIHDSIWSWMKYSMFHSSWNNEYCHIYPSYDAEEIPNKGSLARLVLRDDFEIIVVEDTDVLFFKILPVHMKLYSPVLMVEALKQLKEDPVAKKAFEESTFKEKIRVFDGFLTYLPVDENDARVSFYLNEEPLEDGMEDMEHEDKRPDLIRLYIKKYTWCI